MPSRARLDWDGDALIERVRHAAAEALNETVDAARDDAKATHAWRNDPRRRRFRKGGAKVDTHLERQLATEHADPAGRRLIAAFGYRARKGFYGLFHEEGTVDEYARPTLRPAADRHFETLADRIRRRLR